MKKVKFALSICVLLAVVFCFSGCAFKNDKYKVTFIVDGNTVFCGDYTISRKQATKIFFKHKNNISNYLHSFATSGEAIAQLNAQLVGDIDGIVAQFTVPPTAATVSYEKGVFSYVEGKNGAICDKERIIDDIISNFSEDIVVKIAPIAVKPTIAVSDLKARTVKIAEYTTSFSTSSYERKHNIGVACAKIDDTVIAPNQQFSYNAIVGDRTVENGFLEAGIIVNGAFTKGVGGGVCQVSTTVYNAALIAGMKINDVAHHSLPVHYAPLSLDAMVSRSTDLKFTNTSGYNIYMQAKTVSDKLTVTIFGTPAFDGKRVHLRSNIIRVLETDEYEQIIAPELLGENEATKIIKAPKCGFLSESYLEIYDGETRISSIKIRTDSYAPQKGKIAVRDTGASIQLAM